MRRKRHLKIIIAIICVVCFAAAFIVSAIHYNIQTGNSSSSVISCQRTLMPECKCDSTFAPIRIQLQNHLHNGSHVDCFVCVIVQKCVNQIKQSSAAEALIFDLDLLILTGICFMLITAGVQTPVKLKTRTNN